MMGWCKGRFNCLSLDLAAACFSMTSADFTQISSICSSVKHCPEVVIRYPSSPCGARQQGVVIEAVMGNALCVCTV